MRNRELEGNGRTRGRQGRRSRRDLRAGREERFIGGGEPHPHGRREAENRASLSLDEGRFDTWQGETPDDPYYIAQQSPRRGSSSPWRGGFRGRGPKDYQRSDERIREDVCDRLTDSDEVDASDISVTVEGGEVTLEGTVDQRPVKWLAEDIASRCSGVKDVHNRLRVDRHQQGA